MRNWIKKIVKECLRELEEEKRFIRACRDPTPYDCHSRGTLWENTRTRDLFFLKGITMNWEPKENAKDN